MTGDQTMTGNQDANSSKVPKWLAGFVTDKDLDAIETAIDKSEKVTTVEIIPMVVERSSHTGHVSWMLGLLLLVFFFIVMSVLPQAPDLAWGLAVLVIPLSLVLSRLAFIARHFVTPEDRTHQVMARAEIEFHRILQKSELERHPGVLIFVSMLERKVVVLADPSVSQKLPKEAWQNLIQHFLPHFKSHDLGRGFEEALLECGRILQGPFPTGAGGHGQNEIPNELIIKS